MEEFELVSSINIARLLILQKKKARASALIKDLNPSFMVKNPVTSTGLELHIVALKTCRLLKILFQFWKKNLVSDAAVQGLLLKVCLFFFLLRLELLDILIQFLFSS